MMGTEILKIDAEMAEKIKVEVVTMNNVHGHQRNPLQLQIREVI